MLNVEYENEEEKEIQQEIIHLSEIAYKHISKVKDCDAVIYETIRKGFNSAGRISRAVNAI